ncbi:GntR family transcriptional regulator [Mobilicoccus caccae]|uniref:GntR family transcriptional regulator n=1 Tax=Mobilicoccus caccae TaxID=1859295 RepID=A0ABQ6IW37_9MICO|nr:GntR family transcriptional regulator [Mobilicoccus caccae]GMA41565.1 GntR family transcriptional regulator [Mobilicoccus caccae]
MPIPSKHGVHRRALLRDHVYESIRDAIVDGTLVPGERLRDVELQEWLGVSRTPIREALLRLERAGMVVATPGRATLVSPVDAEATLDAQQIVAAMHELAARLATPVLDADGIAAMTAANARFAAAMERGDAGEALAADDEFHDVLVAASGNEALAAVLEQWTPVLRRVARRRFDSLSGRESVAQHERIVERVAAGDAEGAALASRENWLSLRPEAQAT